VTVVICAYSEARWDELRAAIASVERQTFSPCECLLVIDHNRRLFHRSLEAFPNVEVVENANEKGLAGARNSGVSRAGGQVLAFLDDDAWAEPDWLTELLGPYSDPMVVGTGGLVVPVWDGNVPEWFPKEFYWVVGCSYSGLPETAAPIRNPIGACMSFRRSVFEEVGLFSTNLGRIAALPLGCEETEFAIRTARQLKGTTIVHVPTAVVHHRVGRERLSIGYFARRCFAEGVSKSTIARDLGWRDALSAERVYVRRVLPSGIKRGLVRSMRKEPQAFYASLAMFLGVAAASLGYGVGRAGFASVGVSSHEGEGQATPVEASRPEDAGNRETEARIERASLATRPTDAECIPRWESVEQVAVSVVICCHLVERWDWLRAAVQSVADQTIPVAETVVVIDGDQDLAKLAVEHLSNACTVVALDVRGGLSEARNAGLAAVTTRFVAFLDDDAEAEHDWLQQLMEPLSDPQVLGVSGRSVPIWEHGEPAWFPPELLWVVGCSYLGLPSEVGEVRNVFGGCAAYRSELFEIYGGFRSDFGRHLNDAAGGEETDFCLRASEAEAYRSFMYNPRAIIHHHVPASRTTVAYIAKRSFAEGRAKARLVARTRYGIARRRLETETSYALNTVARAVFTDARGAIRGDVSGLSQSAVLAVSMLAATCGFVSGLAIRSRVSTATGTSPAAPPSNKRGARALMDGEEDGPNLLLPSVTFRCSTCGAVFCVVSELRAHAVEHGTASPPEHRAVATITPQCGDSPLDARRGGDAHHGNSDFAGTATSPFPDMTSAPLQGLPALDSSEPRTEKASAIVPRRWRAAVTALALTADLLLATLTAFNQSGPLRYWSGLVFVLFVPGWAITRFLSLDWPAAEISIAVGASLAINTVMAQAMLTAHAWHPELAQISLAIALLPLLSVPLVRRSRSQECTGPPQ
jgi:GT2 family glycosyltransferase